MVEKGIFYGVFVVLVATLIAVSSFAAFYYSAYNQEVATNDRNVDEVKHLLSRYGTFVSFNMLIDFGNGTRHWYNGTRFEPGWNLYTATLAVTNGNVNATCCAFGSHFVTGIYGVQNSAPKNRAWLVWTYNRTNSWREAQVGVDQLNLFNDSAYAWTFCYYNPTTYAPLCRP
jgi:hypothetical protein